MCAITFGEITLNKDNLLDLRKKTKFNCAASQGELQKKWCIDTSGRRYMIKGNYGESYQQSINELFATELHRKQKFENFTVYTPTLLTVEGGIEGLGCLSYDFCSENLECISAWELLQSVKLKQNESYYYPLKKVCLGLGIKEEEFDYFMDYEIMTDYLISNTDRHMNNISYERAMLVSLSTRRHIKAAVWLREGTSDRVSLDVKDVVATAIKGGTDAVVLCHNHPNGVALPSMEDMEATGSIARALGLVNIHLLDHFILTDTECFSMRDAGRLPIYDFKTGTLFWP